MAGAAISLTPLAIAFLLAAALLRPGCRRDRPQVEPPPRPIRNGDRHVLLRTPPSTPRFVIAPVPRRLFGSFVEHMGRCVYGGIYEPGHPGGRRRRLPHRRPRARPASSASAWCATRAATSSPATAGRTASARARTAPSRSTWPGARSSRTRSASNEFMAWARQAGVEPMMAVNLGTRGVEDACDLLEYANYPGGTALLRPAHRARRTATRTTSGCGAWATRWTARGRSATRPPSEYGRLAAETAKAMRRIDPSIELVACGSSERADADLRSLGGRRSSTRPTTSSTTSRCTPTTSSTPTTGPASSPPRSRWTSSSTASSRPATTSRRRSAHAAS